MDNIRIKGLGNLILTGDKPLPDKEYLVVIRTALEGITKDLKDPENPSYTYLMRYLSTEQINEIGNFKRIRVENGKTDAQKIRWAIEKVADKRGLDREEFYHQEQSRRLAEYMKEIEE